MLPESGSCNVAMVRINVDFPAPFGPNRPKSPVGNSNEILSSALIPFLYVFERFLMMILVSNSVPFCKSLHNEHPNILFENYHFVYSYTDRICFIPLKQQSPRIDRIETSKNKPEMRRTVVKIL